VGNGEIPETLWLPYGYLEKLSFCPNAAFRVKILSSEYQLYACGKIFTRLDFEPKS